MLNVFKKSSCYVKAFYLWSILLFFHRSCGRFTPEKTKTSDNLVFSEMILFNFNALISVLKLIVQILWAELRNYGGNEKKGEEKNWTCLRWEKLSRCLAVPQLKSLNCFGKLTSAPSLFRNRIHSPPSFLWYSNRNASANSIPWKYKSIPMSFSMFKRS